MAENNNINLVDLIEQPAWKTILIELVQTERMNPWDIDILELADKYLQKINNLGGTDLRLPANAILASAILLKFKSRILKLSELDEEEETIAEEAMDEEEKRLFEAMLPELRGVRKFKEGKVSLDALVEAIENVLEKSKKKKMKALEKDIPEFRVPFEGFNIEEKMEDVYKKIQEMTDSQGLVLFSKLVNGNDVIAIVDTFIPCLFLSNQNKINMWQEDFFGEIFISLRNSNEKV